MEPQWEIQGNLRMPLHIANQVNKVSLDSKEWEESLGSLDVEWHVHLGGEGMTVDILENKLPYALYSHSETSLAVSLPCSF